MSVLGSQVDVDMEESVPDPVPKHQGHTGTGCYKLHDHEFMRPRGRPARKGGGGPPPAPPGGNGPVGQPANLMDLPVAEIPTQQTGGNTTKALKHLYQRTPVSGSTLPARYTSALLFSQKSFALGGLQNVKKKITTNIVNEMVLDTSNVLIY